MFEKVTTRGEAGGGSTMIISFSESEIVYVGRDDSKTVMDSSPEKASRSGRRFAAEVDLPTVTGSTTKIEARTEASSPRVTSTVAALVTLTLESQSLLLPDMAQLLPANS